MSNILKVVVKSTECNGWPNLNFYFENQLVEKVKGCSELHSFEVDLQPAESHTFIKLERYGKTDNNCIFKNEQIIKDQTIEIVRVSVDDIKLPDHLIYQNCYIEFDGFRHDGSRFLGPNGVWVLNFKTPIITFFLDQKIEHEAKYNDDYKYPWSYRLGPRSVSTLTKEYQLVRDLIHRIL